MNPMRVHWLSVLIAVGCTCIAACAGSGVGLDSNGLPIGSESMTGGPITATFDSIQDNVFTPICSVCHAGGAAPEGLRLDSADSYANLVGVPSTEVPSILRVKPGDPDNSYLVQKIEGIAAVGARMPYGGPYLDQTTINAIRQWITDGAQRPVTSSVGAFAIASVVPSRGDLVLGSPARIVVALTRVLDVTRLDGSSVRLERLTAEPSGMTSATVPVDLSVPSGNPQALLITPRLPLATGHYRLILTDPPDTGVSAIDGARLRPAAAGGAMTDFTVEADP
jgi:hypothetical protein